MVQFENISPRPLPREARAYRDEDDFFRDVVDFVVTLRAARAAWQCGPAIAGEWHAFRVHLHQALRSGTSLTVMIEDARNWGIGWWRRSHFINQAWR
jgi:hypothetical protein